MSLNSVMQTALSGMAAATTVIDVAANNLANSRTAGFKASRVELATLPFQSRYGGSAGANPIQVGGGVMVAGTSVDFSQGPIAVNDQPALLALEGEGLFILEGPSGERFYTRDGQFTLSSTGELLTRGGFKVLGHAVADDGSINSSELVPLSIHLGSNAAGENGQAVTLRSFAIQFNGRVIGLYNNGRQRTLGQLRLARFVNPHALVQQGGNRFRASPASGLPRESNPASDGAAQVIPGATELSNVDIGGELIGLQLAENQLRANFAVIHTADSLLDALFFPWRVR